MFNKKETYIIYKRVASIEQEKIGYLIERQQKLLDDFVKSKKIKIVKK
ncbi:MAG: hypothetical protein WC349_03810 [Patescibacteria group bacterium]|jgi:hypothetical protein